MNDDKKRGKKRGLSRKTRNTFTTKSGQTIKVNRSIGDRLKARKDSFSRQKALRLAGMPKNPMKRFAYRMHPKRLYHYWFSREGGIMALKIAGIGMITTFLLLIGLFAYFRKDLPNLRDISGNNIGGSIRYYDRTGEHLLWEDYDAVKRIPVEDKEISQYMKDATVAIEDKDFFHHGGFDVRGITRAAFSNITGKGGTQGGSTITQQLVKLTYKWTDQRTYSRKVKEIILSVELEREYTKQEILTGYLNTAPYGNVQYGVEAAARDYFEKSAKDLTLDEAAFLAAIPKSPSYYSPYGPFFNGEALVGREHYILDQMQQQGMITAQQRDEAKKVDVLAKYKEPKQKFSGITAPWFVLTAKNKLIEARGAESVLQGGWTVITTLDYDKQKLAEEQVAKGMGQVKRQGGDTAAFVAEDVKTGQVVALVGGTDFNDPDHGQNNYARAKLPPGSSIKPYDYLTLMEKSENVGAGSVIYDQEGPIEGYPCTNKSRTGNCLHDYDFRNPGPITIRYALGGSRNIPAVKAFLMAGADNVLKTADSFMNTAPDKSDTFQGYRCYEDNDVTLTKEKPCYGSAGIGDGAFLKLDEHVHGYATMSRNGLNLPQTYILKVLDANKKTVQEWKPSAGKQVSRPDSAYIIGDMLSDPNASYFSSKPQRFNGSKGNWKFSLKTGTTNDAKDGWMMGFTTQYAAGVWVGYHDRSRAMSGSMENMTLPIWGGWMRSVHNSIAPVERDKPAGVQSLPAYVVRSHVGFGSIEPSPSTDLFPGWYKARTASNKKQTIDIISNKLATDCTPSRARKDVTEGDPLSFSVDKFVGGGGGANTTESDDVHQCSDARPGITVSAIKIGGSYTISGSVTQGTHPLSGNGDKGGGKIVFSVNGNTIQTLDANAGGYSFSYTPDFTGDQTLTATVIDSVLYDDSATTTLTGNSSFGNGGSSISLTYDGKTGSTYKFSWSAVSGAAKYKLCYSYNNSSIPSGCPETTSTNGSISNPTPSGSYTAKVLAIDSGGNTIGTSNSVSFTVN